MKGKDAVAGAAGVDSASRRQTMTLWTSGMSSSTGVTCQPCEGSQGTFATPCPSRGRATLGSKRLRSSISSSDHEQQETAVYADAMRWSPKHHSQ